MKPMKMNKDRRIKWFLPFFLFMSVIFDAALPAIFPNAFLANDQTIVSSITLYILTLFAFYFKEDTLLINAFIFGLFTDSYNTTILGIYGTLYFIIAYMIKHTKIYFPKLSVVHMMIYLISITFCQFLIFVFYRELSITNVTLTQFLATQLWPTLIFNLVLSFLLYFPSKGLLAWLGYEDYLIL